uniref:Putative secreted protein n=1 Tax=Ixodes ricinus TaxID=34613 RepID=A0A0K8RMK8_IXORI
MPAVLRTRDPSPRQTSPRQRPGSLQACAYPGISTSSWLHGPLSVTPRLPPGSDNSPVDIRLQDLKNKITRLKLSAPRLPQHLQHRRL